MERWWDVIEREEYQSTKKKKKNLPLYNFVHHIIHMECFEIEPGFA
jgi:hypothetical protein